MPEKNGLFLPQSHEVKHVNFRPIATTTFDEGIVVYQRFGDNTKLLVHLGDGVHTQEERSEYYITEINEINLGRVALT